jgi:ribosomal protein S21
MINVEVQRHGNENVVGLMRRFSRRMQGAGVIKRVRSIRYYSKNSSDAQMKKDALMRITRSDECRELFKQGREVPTKKKRR